MTGRKFTVSLGVVLFIMLFSSCVCDDSGSPQARVCERTPVIFDTDIGDDIDDTWALAFLLQCPELDVKLITTELGDSESQVKIVAKMLAIAGRTDIPIGRGMPYRSKQGHNQDCWIEDYNLSSYPGTIYADGVQAIIDTIMNSTERITVIAVGPLPNIAEALRHEPKIAHKARFVGMHGSIRKGYGGRAKPSAEYNVRAVVEAAQKVFGADWDMTITPLDTCGIVKLDGEKYQKVLQSSQPLARAVMENYRVWMDTRRRLGQTLLDVNSTSSTLYDTVAVYLAVSRQLVEMEKLGIAVTGDGYTVIDENAKEINCAVEWKDLNAFEGFLAGRLTK
jgi:inosine-uridine nucleoside N-ribohydrolase